MNHLPALVNELVVVKNQAQAQEMNQARNSPPAPIRDHHQILALCPKVWKAM